MAKLMKKYSFLAAVLMMGVLAWSVSGQRPGAQPTPTPRPGAQPTPAQRPASQPTTTPAPPAGANVSLPISKMGVIYTELFLDPKTGILKFNTLITKLNAEFQKIKDDIQQMQTRATQLQDEIGKLQNAPAGTPIDQRSLATKADQLEQLKKDIQRKAEDAQAAYNRRRTELFAPLQEDIGRALEAFAKARNINVIIDGTQVPLIYAAASTDITVPFISEFNSKNPVTAATTPPQ
jgi:Skp family chaperone for outer membrane proteins